MLRTHFDLSLPDILKNCRKNKIKKCTKKATWKTFQFGNFGSPVPALVWAFLCFIFSLQGFLKRRPRKSIIFSHFAWARLKLHTRLGPKHIFRQTLTHPPHIADNFPSSLRTGGAISM
jgi:hypothetical protein